MHMNFTKLMKLTLVVVLLPLISNCVIIEVDQVDSANAGDTIDVYMPFHTVYADENAHYGILGLLIPTDWTVVSVTFEGDLGSGTASFLHPDSADGDPGGRYEYWADSLELHFPSSDDMHWVVYQSDEPFAVEFDTSYVDVNIQMTVGQKNGNYNLGYFISSGASEINPPPGGGIIWYGISLENPIEVTGGSSVPTSRQIPDAYQLSQNYPNPFNPTTTISYELAVSGITTLKVYNLLGEEVASLVNQYAAAGSHNVVFDASQLESGIYYYKIHSGDFVATRKFVLVK